MQKQNLLLKNQVIALRKAGKTYVEINKITRKDIPKSTLSYWCRQIQLTPKQELYRIKRNQQNIKRAQQQAWLANKRRREIYLSEIIKENNHLLATIRNADTAKITLVILYICEGSKNRRGALTFGNSSPEVIKMFLGLLRQCYPTDEKKFRCTVQCRADQNIKKLEYFWSQITKIPLSQFYTARIDPRTIGKRTQKHDYKGVCRIDYLSGHIFTELIQIGNMLLSGS